MKNKLKIVTVILFLVGLFLFSGCGAGHVSVGVGVYTPGAWGPYGGGYHPPAGIGVGYPVY